MKRSGEDIVPKIVRKVNTIIALYHTYLRNEDLYTDFKNIQCASWPRSSEIIVEL